jgi:hypothetical protein
MWMESTLFLCIDGCSAHLNLCAWGKISGCPSSCVSEEIVFPGPSCFSHRERERARENLDFARNKLFPMRDLTSNGVRALSGQPDPHAKMKTFHGKTGSNVSPVTRGSLARMITTREPRAVPHALPHPFLGRRPGRATRAGPGSRVDARGPARI